MSDESCGYIKYDSIFTKNGESTISSDSLGIDDPWITFNIRCSEKEGIDINIKDYSKESFYKDTFFFETNFFAKFMKKEEDNVVVQEGAESCPVCSSSRILSFQIQDRSADEAMSNNFECTKCGNKWKN